jgi:3-hydroxyisobutyrate dehydrogenase-like beta-hydroxyacid dehydrogenase
VIGSGLAISLVNSGRPPIVFTHRPSAAEAIAGLGGVADSPAELARRCDVVMVAVLDAPQARVAITGPGGLLQGAHEGLTVALLSTVDVPVVHELAAAADEQGVRLLDCGVTGARSASENGMVAVIGGETADVERARPVLEDWAKAVVHCGPVGAGMATKIAHNVIVFCSWRVVYEAIKLAAKAGVEGTKLIEAMQTGDPDGTLLLTAAQIRDGAIGPVVDGPEREAMEAILKFGVKDLDAAHDLAGDLGIELPVLEIARERMAETFGVTDLSASR